MVSSPVLAGGEEIPVYMGYTRGEETYYLEPSITRHISNQAERWEREGYSVDLERGEACVYTVDMAMFHGITKKQVRSVHALTGDYVLLEEPRLGSGDGAAAVEIVLGVSGDARVILRQAAGGPALLERGLRPGEVARISEKVPLPEGAGELVLVLQNAAGEQVLARGDGE